MNILVLCEASGRVRDAFADLGHFAVSVDTLDTTSPRGNRDADGRFTHWVGDALDAFYMFQDDGMEWDLLLAFPPCTYLCGSGLHWNKRKPGRAAKTDKALKFVTDIWKLPVKRKCLEKPKGCINTRLPFMPKPQYIQPHDFGEDASKGTGLWLDNLPKLKPTGRYDGRIVEWPKGSGKMVERWGNQTDSGQNRLGPSETRATERGTTYPGIARAFADQWGALA